MTTWARPPAPEFLMATWKVVCPGCHQCEGYFNWRQRGEAEKAALAHVCPLEARATT